jgi:hypothetical protein
MRYNPVMLTIDSAITALKADAKGLALWQTAVDMAGAGAIDFSKKRMLIGVLAEFISGRSCFDVVGRQTRLNMQAVQSALASCEAGREALALWGDTKIGESYEKGIIAMIQSVLKLPKAQSAAPTKSVSKPAPAAIAPASTIETPREKYHRLRDAVAAEKDPAKREQLSHECQKHRSENWHAIYAD